MSDGMKQIIPIVLFLSAALTLSAQQRISISGKIRDSKGAPVAGAVVVLKGNSSFNAVSSADGSYNISLPSGKADTLQFSCLSYKTLDLPVGRSSVINATLEEDSEQLEEVVVVGYGAMRRSDLTGSVTSVRIDEDKASRSTTLDQMLEGHAAGVQVLSESSAPDAGISIHIRGIASFSGSTDPLYVVDGVIMNGSSSSVKTMHTSLTSNQSSENTNGLSGINPQDIASIEILKDASATAIYGSQGANGVVLITTKEATRDTPVIYFNPSVTVSTPTRMLDVLDFDDYVDLLEHSKNSKAEGYLKSLYEDPSTHSGLKVEPVDWQEYIFRTAVKRSYYFSVTGKPKGYNYLFSVYYGHNEGVIRTSQSDGITVRLNLSKELSKSVKLSFKSSVGYTNTNLVTGKLAGGNISSQSSVLRSTLRCHPFKFPASGEEAEEYDAAAEDDINFSPERYVRGSSNISEKVRVNPSLNLEWRIMKGLTFTSTLGADYTTDQRTKSKVARLAPGYGNIAGIGAAQRLYYNWDNLLTFNRKLNAHSLTGTIGQSFSSTSVNTQSITGYNLPQANARELAINNSLPAYTTLDDFTINESTLLSYFLRAIYSFKNRYVLTATVRADGSSKFSGANKWSVFPSFAGAWRITEEPWFDVPAISSAKLRLGWGLVGNQAVSNYQTSPTFSVGVGIGNHSSDTGKDRVLIPSNIPNPNLKWETSDQVNAGFDLSLWKGRFTLTVDAYRKDTRDLLQSKILPPSNGLKSMFVNDGSIRNEGLEFTVDAIALKKKKLELSLGGNISFNRNKILGIGASGDSGLLRLSPDGEEVRCNYFYGSSLQSSGDSNPLNIFIEGQPMGLFYGYVTDGIVQEGEQGLYTDGYTRDPGYQNYKDLNGNGVLDPGDRCVIGNPMPKFTYGFYAGLDWKRFHLKLDFNGQHGSQIFNLNNLQDYDTSISKNMKNMRRDAYYKAWTPENKSESWPSMDVATADPQLSDRYVEDGSYLRLADVTLSYDIYSSGKKKSVFSSASVGLSCGNAFILTSYSGYSPLNNAYGNDVKRMGVDLNTSPFPRSYSFNVKFKF